MKHEYFLFSLFLLIGIGMSYSQDCPESIGTQSISSEVHFRISSGSCESYPDDITIDGRSFSKSGCAGTNLYYTVNPPDTPLSSPDTFTADFGFGICSYIVGERQTLSVERPDDRMKFTLSPNPVNKGGIINLNFQSPVNAAISIFDLTGKRLITQTLNSSMYARFNLSGLSNGIYLLKIESDQVNETRKIIIQQ